MPPTIGQTLAVTLRRWRRAAGVGHLADALFLAFVNGGGTAAVLQWLRIENLWACVGVFIVAFVLGYRCVPTLGDTAAMLDRRFALDDLLASAWAVRGSTSAEGGDWRATLLHFADARAAGLPRPGWLGRWSVRQHVCGLAGVLILFLSAALVPPPELVESPTLATNDAAVPGDPGLIADVRRRAADSADEATNVPAPTPAASSTVPAETRANAAKLSSAAGQAADGAGRADGVERAESPGRAAAHSAPASPTATGRGGSGTAIIRPGDRRESQTQTTGRVAVEDKTPADDATVSNRSPSAEPASPPPSESGVGRVPGEYRAMIQAFFDR